MYLNSNQKNIVLHKSNICCCFSCNYNFDLLILYLHMQYKLFQVLQNSNIRNKNVVQYSFQILLDFWTLPQIGLQQGWLKMPKLILKLFGNHILILQDIVKCFTRVAPKHIRTNSSVPSQSEANKDLNVGLDRFLEEPLLRANRGADLFV